MERRVERGRSLTHVELTNKARHVVVFKVLWQNLLCESSLVEHVKTSTSLKRRIFKKENDLTAFPDGFSCRNSVCYIFSVTYRVRKIIYTGPITPKTQYRGLKVYLSKIQFNSEDDMHTFKSHTLNVGICKTQRFPNRPSI